MYKVEVERLKREEDKRKRENIRRRTSRIPPYHGWQGMMKNIGDFKKGGVTP